VCEHTTQHSHIAHYKLTPDVASILVSHALFEILTLSTAYSFLPGCPKTWLPRVATRHVSHTMETCAACNTHRYLDARTKRDMLMCDEEEGRGDAGIERETAMPAGTGNRSRIGLNHITYTFTRHTWSCFFTDFRCERIVNSSGCYFILTDRNFSD